MSNVARLRDREEGERDIPVLTGDAKISSERGNHWERTFGQSPLFLNCLVMGGWQAVTLPRYNEVTGDYIPSGNRGRFHVNGGPSSVCPYSYSRAIKEVRL